MKRQRGRGRKSGGNPGNRPHESNGPEVKIRGTAAQIHEKYIQYARDAQSSGDRVRYENLMQHAEHYFRILAATMPKDRLPGQQENQQRGADGDDEGNGNEADSANAEAEAEAEEETAASEAASEKADDGGDEGASKPRRRRGRRRPSQDGEKAESDGEARSALDDLARKQAAVAGS